MSIARFPTGSSYSIPLQVMQADGITPSAMFLGTDTLAATVWTGDDQTFAAHPAVAWTDATTAKYAVNFVPTDTAGLPPGAYRIRVTATRSTDVVPLLDDSIEILVTASTGTGATFTATITGSVITAIAVVGGGTGYPASSTTIPVTIIGGGGWGATATATSNSGGVITSVTVVTGGSNYASQPTITAGIAAPSVYCTYEDMACECSWIGQFLDMNEDQTGFAEQRKRARDWMDALILKAAPVTGMGQLISRQAWWSWGYNGVDPRSGTGLAIDRVLMGYLANNCLMTTTPQGLAIVRACAYYAISLVLQAQMGAGGDFGRYAGFFARKANAEASTIIAEIDINSDGRPEYAISLGITNTRGA